MSLLLIRHGATEWSEDGRHQHDRPPLTAAGAADAEGGSVPCSPHGRSRWWHRACGRVLDTRRRFGDRPPGGGAVEAWDDLRRSGTTAGTRPPHHARHPGRAAGAGAVPYGRPGGESPSEAAARADAAAARVRAVGRGRRAVLARATSCAPAARWRVGPSRRAGTRCSTRGTPRVSSTPSGRPRHPTLERPCRLGPGLGLRRSTGRLQRPSGRAPIV